MYLVLPSFLSRIADLVFLQAVESLQLRGALPTYIQATSNRGRTNSEESFWFPICARRKECS